MATVFEWDTRKDKINREKHGIAFNAAVEAFYDTHSVITRDPAHGLEEHRYFCYGKVDGRIITVRFTYRGSKIRIIGAAEWRKGKKIYAEKNC